MLINYLTLLVAFGLVQARPNEDFSSRLWEAHKDCPPAETHYLLPHEYECSKFYYCEYGLKYIEPRNCAAGTWFSYSEQVCVHAWESDCTLPGGSSTERPAPTAAPPTPAPTAPPPVPPQPPTPAPEIDFLENGCPADFEFNFHLPHETYCNKYYHCLNGEKVARVCPRDLWFNAQLQVCDWPRYVECSGEIYEPESEEEEDTPAPPAPTAVPTAGPPAPTAGPPQPPTPAPEIDFLENGCPADFEFNFHLPHETYCNKYYHCLNGQKVTRVCPRDLWFNAQLQVCDWPRNVECSGEIYEPETEEEEDTPAPPAPTAGPPGPTAGPPQPPTPAPEIDFLENGCPADFEFNFHLPHETYCNKYYHCLNGEKVARLCPSGLWFNAQLQVCDWPRNVECSGDIYEPESEEEEATPAPPAPTDGPVAPTAGPPQPPTPGPEIDFLENGCPADFGINFLLPHETYCNKYYHCVNGETLARLCPRGLFFNPQLQVCDWPINVDCSGDIYDVEDNDSDNDSEDSGNGSEDSDNGSEDSDNGSEDSDNGSEDNDSGDVLDNGCPADFDVHKLLPHETACDKFYYCVFGEKVERNCAPGTYFNYEIQVCDWPWNVDCVSPDDGGSEGGDNGSEGGDNGSEGGDNGSEDGDNGSEGGDNGSEGGDNGSEDGDNGSEGGDNGSEDGGSDNSDWEALPNGCPADSSIEWLLPSETDCAGFYQCDNGLKIERSCAAGTHFNFALQICDWPANVGCEIDGGDNGNQPDDEDEDDLPGGDDEGGDGGNDGNGGGNDENDGGNDESDGGNDESDGGNDESDGGNDDGTFETLPNGCPADFDIHWLLPYENDCSQFVQCVNGEFGVKSCPPGLHFNARLQVCDWPRYAGCDPNYEVDDNDNESDGGNDNDNESDGGNDNNGNRCLDECNVLPWAAEDCDKYWICNGQTPVLISCSEGLYFNVNALTCDFPVNRRCIKGRWVA